MSIKYYANRVKESSTTNGTGNLVLSGAITGYRSFSDVIGANNLLSYYIYRIDNDFEWEIGTGYISSSGGIDQLVRQTVIASSSSNNLVSFSGGTKFIETIISQDRVNTSFNNVESKSANFTADYIPTTYIIDASSSNVQVSLPTVVGEDPIILGFLLNQTIGGQYEQANAVEFLPYGTETVNGNSSDSLSILNDYIQLVSVPSQSGWLFLDPIQDSTSAYGIDGTIQIVNNQAFSGVAALNWNSSNSSLQIGGTGNLVTADVIIPISGGTVVFNEQSLDKDFRIEGSGLTHLLFIDASTNNIGINNSNPLDTVHIKTSETNGLTIESSGTGPELSIHNSSTSGNISNDRIGALVFSGLNTSNNGVPYVQLSAYIDSATAGSEKSAIKASIYDNGIVKDNLIISTDGLTVGSDNDNTDGIVIGTFSDNIGQNIQVGSNTSSSAQNSILLGNDNVLSSGSTYCGIIGNDHSVSGTNIWIIGGSGISASGSNSTYLCYDNTKYIKISQSGDISYNTSVNSDINFNLINTSILSSGINETIGFVFMNSSNMPTTGLLLRNNVTALTSGLENSKYQVFVLVDGNKSGVIDLGKNTCSVGYNSVSGTNIVYGLNNAITNSGNIVYGTDINSSGTNNILLGRDISCSGSGALVVGSNMNALTSGVIATGIVLLGNNNNAYENYAIALGNNNTSSGLYSVSMGYDNGAHGDYSVAIGENNTVVANGSVAVGRSNTLDNSSFFASVFAVGNGNYADIEETGVIVGYNNSIYGSGGIIFGQSSSVSGLNNIVCGIESYATGLNNIIHGMNSSASGTDNIVIGHNRTVVGNSGIHIFANNTNGLLVKSTGIYFYSDDEFTFDDNIIVIGTGTFASGIISSGSATFYSGINIAGGTGIFSSGIVSSGTSTFVSGIFTNITVSNAQIASGISVSGAVNIYGISSFNSGVILNSGVIINSLSTPTGTNITPTTMPTGTSSIHKMIYQTDSTDTINNSRLRYENLATSGSLSGASTYLSANDAEYQFLTPTVNPAILYLPNGTGLYMGKKFTIVNRDTGFYIFIRKSGYGTELTSLAPSTNISLVHAGNDNWITISSSNN
jgi:hypothetical protein